MIYHKKESYGNISLCINMHMQFNQNFLIWIENAFSKRQENS